MEARASVKHIRISPRKVKVVLDIIRGKDAAMAASILKHTPKAACEYLGKLLHAAVANAENNHHMEPSKLYISECFVCPGPILKRIRPSAHGRAYEIQKKTSHVTLVLREKEEA